MAYVFRMVGSWRAVVQLYCPVDFCWLRLWVKYGTLHLPRSAGLEGWWTTSDPPLPGLLSLNQGQKSKTQAGDMTVGLIREEAHYG